MLLFVLILVRVVKSLFSSSMQIYIVVGPNKINYALNGIIIECVVFFCLFLFYFCLLLSLLLLSLFLFSL